MNGTFDLFDVMCKQHSSTAMNPLLNGNKNGDVEGTCNGLFTLGFRLGFRLDSKPNGFTAQCRNFCTAQS